ncbi:hypothetical protein NUSPORA_01232 [Nucleospora cyclopteri]
MGKDGKFDAFDYINTNFKGSTLYEMNDALSSLSKSLSRISYQNKELISSHFSKFVECRMTLENIYDDIQKKGLDRNLTGEIERIISKLVGKYESISLNVNEDIKLDFVNNKRKYYEREFEEIFSLKINLGKNTNNFENFVNIYKRAMKIYEPYKKSEFLTTKIKEVQPEKNQFLGNIYSYICSEQLNFDESCYYFDLYFEVADNKSDRKIMNTLLVTFKESTYVFDEVDNPEEYITYLESSLLKLIKYVDDDIKKSGIDHYFKCFKHVLVDLLSAKIVFKRSKRLYSVLDVSPQIKTHFIQKMTEAKAEVFFNLLNKTEKQDEFEDAIEDTTAKFFAPAQNSTPAVFNVELEKTAEIYESFVEILAENEIGCIQEILLEYIKVSLEKKKFSCYEIFKIQITSVRRCLGFRKSPKNKQLDAFLREKRKGAIQNLSEELNEMIEKRSPLAKTGIIEILTKILKMLRETSTENLKEILFESKKLIMKSPVLYFFLYKFIKMKQPEIGKEEMEMVNSLSRQFEYLLINNKN